MVTVELGKLACCSLEGYFGADLAVGARKALLHYVYKLRVGRPPVAVPRFLEPTTSPCAAIDLTFDRKTEEFLSEEARRQRTTPSGLAAHAVLVYLAELDFLGVVPRGTTPAGGEEPGF
jgi:hypothetical protein